jgi:hypothetical protein
MTSNSNEPDRAARLVSHALVGIAAAGVVSLFVARRHSPEAQLLGALVAVLMHEYFDAPVATKLAGFGL